MFNLLISFYQNNIYDFLIQLYQLSINNFSSNQLYNKFATKYLSYYLGMRVCLKRTNGKWKFYEPHKHRSHSDEAWKSELFDYLNETSIYLYEFKVASNRNPLARLDTNNNTKSNGSESKMQTCNSKIIRILLNKRLWLKNYHENAKICMRFSQFCDPDELNKYNQCKCLIDSLRLLHVFKNACHLSLRINANYLLSSSIVDDFKKIFFAFIMCSPIDLLVNGERESFYAIQQQQLLASSKAKQSDARSNAESENENNLNELLNEINLSSKYDTIGKQFQRFESMGKSSCGKEKLMLFLNHLFGKKQFNDDYINSMYKYLLKEFNILKQTSKAHIL